MTLTLSYKELEKAEMEYRESTRQHASLQEALERCQQEVSMLKERHQELSEKFSELARKRLDELNRLDPIDPNLKPSGKEPTSTSSQKRTRVESESVRDETAAKCHRRRELKNLVISEKVNPFPSESPEARRLREQVKKVSTGGSKVFPEVSESVNKTKPVCLERTHKRPPGRAPKGKKWNEHLRMWVDDTDTCISSSSSMGL